MGVRKNAKFMSPAEREDFVRACVLLKAEIVNPGAPAAQQYDRWDLYVAEHQMIQNAFGPGASFVNFGHGGNGAFSFLSWHRFFLRRLELDLQRLVPGVMLPYWDWQDPATVMTDTFLGPNNGPSGVIERGYFAFDRPGIGSNTTALPPWWPATLAGWRLHSAFGGTWSGGLRRNTRPVSQLPSVADIRGALAMSSYRNFQNALESGNGLPSGNQVHNGMHVWIGGSGGHMSNPAASPLDPFFYLHHCNIDRLWAMWQLDGHASDYPSSGGSAQHHRNDLMYPWTGGAAGYGTNAAIAAAIPMPDYSALGPQRNGDTLAYRSAYGYTYDTLPVIGIALDRTGSMNGLTPDPMTSGAPDVTKWQAAQRGVAAFLQDAETANSNGVAYVTAGVKTFRSLAGNQFDAVFAAPGYGLVKNGTPLSRAGFDSAMTGLTAAGGTPLADALLNVHSTLVEPPEAGLPPDEQRYLALLTDGMLTSGSPLSAIADGSLARTAVFGLGFGTGAEVDYATIASLVAKGRSLLTQQVFHGENAGTVDKFFSDALAAAIGFTVVIDPVLELFAGEHAHVDFLATSADDAFLITAQGMDFESSHWQFHLHGPNGMMLWGDHRGHNWHGGCHACGPPPFVSGSVADGRLSLMVQRGSTEAQCWVGEWRLMVSYKAKDLDAMVMPEIGDWLYPQSAGPSRGLRWARLLQAPGRRLARRSVVHKARHALDAQPASTNRHGSDACDVSVNVYARTRLRLALLPQQAVVAPGQDLNFAIVDHSLAGTATVLRSAARLVSPTMDLGALFAALDKKALEREKPLDAADGLPVDPALVLARLEQRSRKFAVPKDQAVALVQHHGGAPHLHVKGLMVPGSVHLGVWLQGVYHPQAEPNGGGPVDGHGGHGPAAGTGESFSRVFTVSASLAKPKPMESGGRKKKGRAAD